MKIIGIDPGTRGFNLFGIDNDVIFLDESFSTQELAKSINKTIEIVEENMPLDAVIGPSGYGIPFTSIENASEQELDLMLPKKSGNVSVNDAIKSFFYTAKDKKLPVYFTPGVIHLQTVPEYRKANKLDMGTADKLCCAVLALEQYSKDRHIPYSKCSIILLEVGYGFTAAIGIKNGKVVDALGGTSGFAGFLSPGAIDSELAIRIPELPQEALFTGGAVSYAKEQDYELALKNPTVKNMLIESAVKNAVAIMVTSEPDEIILSGRLARIPSIGKELEDRLSPYCKVASLRRKAQKASEGAEGAVILGEGLLGGKYSNLIDTLEIKKAKGTMFDYVTMNVGTSLKQ